MEKASECAFLGGRNQLFILKGKKLKQSIEIGAGINCLHGKIGEDGSLLGFMQYLNIPLLSPGIFAESLSIDKDFTKLILNSLNIPTADFLRFKRESFFEKSETVLKFIEKRLGFPVIVKPARLGSSIGIEKAENGEQLFKVMSLAFRYDDKVIVERYITGARDYNCAVYGVNGKIIRSRVEEIVRSDQIFTFEDKYLGEKTGGLKKQSVENTKLVKQIQDYSERVYRRCDFNGIVRFDFLVQGETVYLNEINAVPGSLAYYLFCDKTAEFSRLLTELLQDTFSRALKNNNLLKVFSSSVLQGDWQNVKK